MSQRYAPAPYRGSRHIDVIIVGAGHNGLAMSAQLSSLDIEHVVLEAGDIGQRWQHERWESLNLLTPNWTLDLPGWDYDGDDPDGFMHKNEVAHYLGRYARVLSAPVKRYSPVHHIRATSGGYLVRTTQGEWRCRAVVLATGAFAQPVVPAIAEAIPEGIQQITAAAYRNTNDVAEGKVLVVGASATGLQLAEELSAAGREVMLSVGEHVRMPRSVAGRDVYWWLMQSGVFWETVAEMDDIQRARKLPSPQLTGGAESLDLNRMIASGVEVAGRFVGVGRNKTHKKAQFSGNLPNLVKSADLKLGRLLQRFSEVEGLADAELAVEPTTLPRAPLEAQFGPGGITSVVWATGFKPDYRWLELDVFNRKGGLVHNGGVVKAQGIYALGLPVMRTRASTFMAGAARDTLEISRHLNGYLNNLAHPMALKRAIA